MLGLELGENPKLLLIKNLRVQNPSSLDKIQDFGSTGIANIFVVSIIKFIRGNWFTAYGAVSIKTIKLKVRG